MKNNISRFLIDIPDISTINDIEPSFAHIAGLDTKEEAIAYCREKFGADEEGCICLISKI